MGAFSIRHGAPTPLPERREEAPRPQAQALKVAQRAPGLSAETRRFSTGMRVIIAILSTALLQQQGHSLGAAVMPIQLAYCAWAGLILLCEAHGRPLGPVQLHYWVDVLWTVLLLQISGGRTDLLTVTLVQPVVLASIGCGVACASAMSLVGALGLIIDVPEALRGGEWIQSTHGMAAIGVLALGPMSAMLAKPMSVLRARLDLLDGLEGQFDARRGLNAVAATLAEGLRVSARADVAGLVLLRQAGRATLATADDGPFLTSLEVQGELERLLGALPHCPVSHVERHWLGLRGGTRAHVDTRTPAWSGDLRGPMVALAALLQVRSLMVVPVMRYGRAHGHLLVGSHERRARMHEVDALVDAAPELHRILEQAALVDQLQEENAAHERVRIGRDLHDSAIQPYLGLKYAVESVALRVAADNPARADIEGLLDLVNGEVTALREIISGLRGGEPRGDNAFVPAVRRQVRRFGLLFGVDIELATPDEIPMSRALAGALFHMVNEALNNVRKHSGARHVWIRVDPHESQLKLVVRNDGAGTAGPFRPRSLAERAAALGGRLDVYCAEGQDTEIVIIVPLQRREPGAMAA